MTNLIKNANKKIFNCKAQIYVYFFMMLKKFEGPLDHLAYRWPFTIKKCYHWTSMWLYLKIPCIYEIANKYPQQQFKSNMNAIITSWKWLTKCQTIITFITNTSDELLWLSTMAITMENENIRIVILIEM
jgi:hypothetical protein